VKLPVDLILSEIWARAGEGFVFLPSLDRTNDRWTEGLGMSRAQAVERLRVQMDGSPWQPWGTDSFFSVCTFGTKFARVERTVAAANDTRLLWADLDGVDPGTLGSLAPSVAWATSKDNYQGVWFLDRVLPLQQQQNLNRLLTYTVGADKGGWAASKVLRVPRSLNFKRAHRVGLEWHGVQKGVVLWFRPDMEFNPGHLEERLQSGAGPVNFELAAVETDAPFGHPVPRLIDPSEELVLGRTARWMLSSQPDDRSHHLWKLAKVMAEDGVDSELAFQFLFHAPFNKFKARPNVLWNTIANAYQSAGKPI
jgi:hypothetical protein